MSCGHRYVSYILLGAVVLSTAAFSGCAARVRVYDISYRDYHRWDHGEAVYYQRWEVETHREHREFRERHSDEQQEYWKWRHNHHDDQH
jgi:hypothetical protein